MTILTCTGEAAWSTPCPEGTVCGLDESGGSMACIEGVPDTNLLCGSTGAIDSEPGLDAGISSTRLPEEDVISANEEENDATSGDAEGSTQTTADNSNNGCQSSSSANGTLLLVTLFIFFFGVPRKLRH